MPLTRRLFNTIMAGLFGHAATRGIAAATPAPQAATPAPQADTPDQCEVIEFEPPAEHLPIVRAIIDRNEGLRISTPDMSWAWTVERRMIHTRSRDTARVHRVIANGRGFGRDGVPLAALLKFQWTRQPNKTIEARIEPVTFWSGPNIFKPQAVSLTHLP